VWHWKQWIVPPGKLSIRQELHAVCCRWYFSCNLSRRK